MKIMISFNDEEKCAINEMPEVTYKNSHVAGSFGELKCNDNDIEINLTTGFIKATINVVSAYINLLKSFMAVCESYGRSWLSDITNVSEADDEKVPTRE